MWNQRRRWTQWAAIISIVAALAASSSAQVISLPPQAPLEGVQLEGNSQAVTLVTSGADLAGVLRMIADQHGLNLVVGPNVSGVVNTSIHNVTLEEVLGAILGVNGYRWHRQGNLLYVTGGSDIPMDGNASGRFVQVYPLDYVAAMDAQTVATALLSSDGTAQISKSDPKDQMKSQELLVVDDVADGHRRVSQYLAQVNLPPRQVLIESHILQVALSKDDRHGINLRALARAEGSRITIKGSGFAENPSTGPSLALQLDGTDMGALIEMLRSHTNSRTLASPKVSVVNRQEARIQIGQRLPYTVATTTQTTTVQSVQFLEVGILMTVTPIITSDGHVLMTITPKVSGGKITEKGFPEEETTEVTTTVLMPDGGGLVIGGLIREDDVHSHSLTPMFSRVPILGKLFERRSDAQRRNELIIALVTHVLPPSCEGPRPKETDSLFTTLPEYAQTSLMSIEPLSDIGLSDSGTQPLTKAMGPESDTTNSELLDWVDVTPAKP